MSDDSSKVNPLFVKRSQAKKGDVWHDLANQRIHKQHHGGEIPEGDRHAIPRYHSPLDQNQSSPEETKIVLDDLETQIKVLKEKENAPAQQAPSSTKPTSPQDDWYD
ncbi:MAG: hypothetical protein ACR2LN_05890 [Candidatus Levyibacteriota bacterium]